MRVLGCLVCLATFTLVRGRLPIPSEPLGFVYKGVPRSAPVHIEVFIDLLCSDSKFVFPKVKQVGNYYGSSVRIAVINFPLPYLRNSYIASKGVYAVNKMTHGNPDKIFDWMSIVFDNMKELGGSANFNVSENKTVGAFADLAYQLGLAPDVFADHVNNNLDIDRQLRTEWKYGASRGIAGAPWFIVNGVLTEADELWTFEDFKEIIDPLLP